MSRHPELLSPYVISFKAKADFLHAVVHGNEDSPTTSIRYWSEIAAECRRREARAVLVEEDFNNTLNVMETYCVNLRIAELDFPRIPVAFVDRVADQLESNQFGETVAVNRGLNAKAFPNVGEAERWLMRQCGGSGRVRGGPRETDA